MDLTPDRIRQLLGLEPHPTCGFVAQTYRSRLSIPSSALPAPYEGSRPQATALYFLVMPETPVRLHRIRADQLYHHYLGGPLEVLMLHTDGTGEVAMVGGGLKEGMRPQLLIPGGTFHAARVKDGTPWALLGSTEWPGVEPADVEAGDADALARSHPVFAAQIRSFAA